MSQQKYLKFTAKKDIFFLCTIFFILLLMNYRVINTWFIVDDTGNIFCSSFSTLELLFDRGTYLYFNQLFFTPLLPIIFKIDWLLFKMNPTGYHLHNLAVAFMGCTVFYTIQRIYFPSFVSWLGTAFLAVSVPVSFDISWITRKHYLWGFLLSLVVLYLFKRWEENKRKAFLFVSILSSLLAFLFKEAYAMLPLVLFCVSSGALKERAKKTLPYFLVLAVYLLWRISMLGSIGGYPGSTDTSFTVLLGRLIHMPLDLSGNLFGFSLLPFLLLVILAFLNIRMFLFFMSMVLIVVSPFIFFPEGGFLLANKALAFVAVISFAISYIADRLFDGQKRLSVLFLIALIPLLFSSISKSIDSQNVVIQLSRNYALASEEITEGTDKKILIVGNYAYYFSNLEDIYRRMLKTDFPRIKSISNLIILPVLQETDFDKIILLHNLDLNPDVVHKSSVDILANEEAEHFITDKMAEYREKMVLSPPSVNFMREKDHIRITVNDPREGTYVRCVLMESRAGCYPIPRRYVFKLNTIKKIDRLDIIYDRGDGLVSFPSSFTFQEG
jgi:hypothetical protein